MGVGRPEPAAGDDMSRPCPECKGTGGYWVPEHPRGGGAPAQIKEDCTNCKGTGTAPSRREEVEEQIKSILRCAENFRVESNALQYQCRTLADEVDARDAIIDKLIALLATNEHWCPCAEAGCLACTCEDCNHERIGKYRAQIKLHARACEIAGREKT